MCALELLASLEKGGDNLVVTVFEGLQEQSRLNIADELGIFIETVKFGDLEKNSEAIKALRPKLIKEMFPERGLAGRRRRIDTKKS